jgi:hypothetical protein
MTTLQARELLIVLGQNPDEAAGTEPKDIALQRVFDPEAADEAANDHHHRWTAPPPPQPNRGKPSKTLLPVKGGDK